MVADRVPDADMARPENARVRHKLGVGDAREDGMFWMSFDDFVDNYSYVSVCMLPASWECSSLLGEWRGASGGGCSNHESVTANPQFALWRSGGKAQGGKHLPIGGMVRDCGRGRRPRS